MTLIATPSDPAANSYWDEPTATAYLQNNRLYTSGWPDDVPTRERALIWACSLLEFSIEWYGVRRTLTQNLAWPRAGVRKAFDGPWFDFDSIPQPLGEAQADLALLIAQKDRTKEPDVLGLGISDLTVGPIRLSISKEQVLAVIPPIVLNKIKWLGVTEEIKLGGPMTVKLVRA